MDRFDYKYPWYLGPTIGTSPALTPSRSRLLGTIQQQHPSHLQHLQFLPRRLIICICVSHDQPLMQTLQAPGLGTSKPGTLSALKCDRSALSLSHVYKEHGFGTHVGNVLQWGLCQTPFLGVMTCRPRDGAAEEEGRLTRRWVSELRRLTGRASDPLC